MPTPAQEITLTKETRDRLGGALAEQVRDLEDEHKVFLGNLETWTGWYEAKPVMERRSEPWPDASNLVVPIIKVAVDGTVSRLHSRLHTQNRTWMGEALNPTLEEMLPRFLKHLNRVGHVQCAIEAKTLDWVWEMVVYGSSVLGLGWLDKYEFRWAPGRGKKPQYVKVQTHRGPVVENIPREQILWQKDRLLQESEYVVRQSYQTWSDLVGHALMDGWDEDTVHECERSAGLDGAQAGILHAKREHEGVDSAERLDDLHDIREIWIELPRAQLSARGPAGINPADLDFEDQAPIPLVVTFHAKARKVLRVVAHPYLFPHWPFYEVYFRKRSGRGSSPGLAKMLDHVQRGVTTIVNQAVDAVTFANSVTLVTSDPRFNSWKFNPGRPIFVRNPQDVVFPNVNKQVVPDVTIANMLTAIGERVSGINDPSLGRETRMGGHPSSATSTLAMLQEGNKLFDLTLRGVRRQLARMGEDMASLIQQFETDEDGWLETIYGEDDAEGIKKLNIPPDIPLSGNVQFDLYALSEFTNPDTEIQRAIMVDQLTGNYYAFLQQAMMILESQDPRIPPGAKVVMAKAVEAKTRTMKRILESNDINDVERYLMESKDGRTADAASLSQMGQQLVAQQQAAAAAQGGPGAAGPGAGGPFGGPPGVPQPGMAGPPQPAPGPEDAAGGGNGEFPQ